MLFIYLNEENQFKMVDIGDKEIIERIVLVSGCISMNKEVYDVIVNYCVKKGLVLQIVIIVGIMGVKKISEFIFMCYLIMFNGVDIDILEEKEIYSFKFYVRVKI